MFQKETLVILLDVNPIEMESLPFETFLNHIFSFIHQMVITDCFQPPAFIVFNQTGAETLFPQPENVQTLISGRIQASNEQEISDYIHNILDHFLKFTSQTQSTEPFHSVRLDMAISKALCLLNLIEEKEMLKRILVLSASDHTDLPFEHTMNTVFCGMSN